MIFTKPLTEQHGSGLLLIAMGIILKMLPDSKPAPWIPTSNVNAKHHPVTSSEEVESVELEEDEEKKPLV